MPPEFSNLKGDEFLRAENEFLKMKLMLEKGAEFFSGQTDVPPEVENQFLNYIEAFENRLDNCKRITVFEKIGKPAGIIPVEQLPADRIDDAWRELKELLRCHSIALDVCRPDVTAKELYRFVTEELFQVEINDIDMPGMVSGFIYDEFYPDHSYDNGRFVEGYLFRSIFSTRLLQEEDLRIADGFRFNGSIISIENFIRTINRFKSCFSKIEPGEIIIHSSSVDGKTGLVHGHYTATASGVGPDNIFSGEFTVLMRFADSWCWELTSVAMEGFDPQ